VVMPGVLVVQSPAFKAEGEAAVRRFCAAYRPDEAFNAFPLVVLVDDSDFAARSLDNWLWGAFTRSDPAADLYGVAAVTMKMQCDLKSVISRASLRPPAAPTSTCPRSTRFDQCSTPCSIAGSRSPDSIFACSVLSTTIRPARRTVSTSISALPRKFEPTTFRC